MKVYLSKTVYDQLTDKDKDTIQKTPCTCNGDLDCEFCEGFGILYEMPLNEDEAVRIEENLRSQGMPLGKGN